VPGPDGLSAHAMLAHPLGAYLLLGCEPELDAHNAGAAARAVRGAQFVVAMTPFRGAAVDYAHVILPIAPFSETSGTFVNTEGRMQSFNAVVRPLGDTRPAWKVLRVLGNLLDLPNFDYETSEAVRDAVCEPGAIAGRLSNAISDVVAKQGGSVPASNGAFERVTDVPIYATDSLVRRASSLQQTSDAKLPRARMSPDTLRKLGVPAGAKVKIRQDGGEAVLEVVSEDGLAPNCVRVAAGHPLTAELGSMFGAITVERA